MGLGPNRTASRPAQGVQDPARASQRARRTSVSSTSSMTDEADKLPEPYSVLPHPSGTSASAAAGFVGRESASRPFASAHSSAHLAAQDRQRAAKHVSTRSGRSGGAGQHSSSSSVASRDARPHPPPGLSGGTSATWVKPARALLPSTPEKPSAAAKGKQTAVAVDVPSDEDHDDDYDEDYETDSDSSASHPRSSLAPPRARATKRAAVASPLCSPSKTALTKRCRATSALRVPALSTSTALEQVLHSVSPASLGRTGPAQSGPFAAADVPMSVVLSRIDLALVSLAASVAGLRSDVGVLREDVARLGEAVPAKGAVETSGPDVDETTRRARMASAQIPCPALSREEYMELTGIQLNQKVYFTQTEAEVDFLAKINKDRMDQHAKKQAATPNEVLKPPEPYVRIPAGTKLSVRFILRDANGDPVDAHAKRPERERLIREWLHTEVILLLAKTDLRSGNKHRSRSKRYHETHYAVELHDLKQRAAQKFKELRYCVDHWKTDNILGRIWKAAAEAERKRVGAPIKSENVQRPITGSSPDRAIQATAEVSNRSTPGPGPIHQRRASSSSAVSDGPLPTAATGPSTRQRRASSSSVASNVPLDTIATGVSKSRPTPASRPNVVPTMAQIHSQMLGNRPPKSKSAVVGATGLVAAPVPANVNVRADVSTPTTSLTGTVRSSSAAPNHALITQRSTLRATTSSQALAMSNPNPGYAPLTTMHGGHTFLSQGHGFPTPAPPPSTPAQNVPYGHGHYGSSLNSQPASSQNVFTTHNPIPGYDPSSTPASNYGFIPPAFDSQTVASGLTPTPSTQSQAVPSQWWK